MALKAITVYLDVTKCHFLFNQKKHPLHKSYSEGSQRVLVQHNIYSHTRAKARIQIPSLCLLDFKYCYTYSSCFAYDTPCAAIFKQK